MSRRLKIAVVQPSPDMGGAETFMLALIQNFQKSGHKVFVASNKSDFFQCVKKVSGHTFLLPFILDIAGNLRGLVKTLIIAPYAIYFYFRLLKKFKKERVDLILMSNFTEKLLVTWLSRFVDIPVVWIEYGPVSTQLRLNFGIPGLMYKLAVKNVNHIIVPSDNTRDNLVKKAHIPRSKIIKTPCGVTIPRIKVNRKVGKQIVVGVVSRLTREKGIDDVIEAVHIARTKNSNIVLRVVGRGPDMEHFKSRARELGVEDSVIFTGYVKDTGVEYAKFDIFAFATVWELEGFGLCAVEAMSRAVPVVAYDTGPVSEVLSGGGAVLVPAGRSNELAKAILRLSRSQKLREKMGSAGRRTALSKYDIRAVARAYLEVFYKATYA